MSDEEKEERRHGNTALQNNVENSARELKAQTKILTHICREQKRIKNDLNEHKEIITEHIKDDEKRLVKLESDVGWMKKVGMFIATALGIGHVLK